MARFSFPQPQPSTTKRWTSTAFREELGAWCAQALGEAVRLENAKQRPWSTLWRVFAGESVFFVKQNCPLQGFEAGLVALLAEIVPDRVVTPTAVDAARDLLLAPDQGAVLEEHPGGDVDRWCRVVAGWASLQRVLAGRLTALEGVGLSTLRAGDAEEYVATRTADLAGLPADDPRAMPADLAERLEAHLPVVRRWAGEVEALGLPLTLTHNDLHEKNVFASGLRFLDFGDAVIANPLGDLLVPLQMMGARRGGVAYDRVVGAFLEVWSDVVPLVELRRGLPACLALARLSRHEAWSRCIPPMNPAELAEFGSSATKWLGTLLEEP